MARTSQPAADSPVEDAADEPTIELLPDGQYKVKAKASIVVDHCFMSFKGDGTEIVEANVASALAAARVPVEPA